MLRLALLASLAACLAGQWSSNPIQNLAVGDRAGAQAVPKIAVTSDGGCYIAWFDNSGAGYAVYLQRLDAAGVEQWPHNGVLVSGHAQNSSLVDWDLIVDRDDAAVLAFTDVRSGPDLDVYAYRIDPSGAFAWGGNGIALSANTDDEANPRLGQASDGDFVCVWPNTTSRSLRVQRLDAAGSVRYPQDGLVIPGDATDTPAFAQIVAGDQGSFIVSWVRALAFSGTRHLHTQKFDAAGQPLWGAQRLVVFDAAILPIAHEPRLLADGQGGAIYGWHFAAGSVFSVRVQRILANGVEAFAHNGIDVATHAASKFDPALLWLPHAQDILVFWNERNTGQSQWGISGQRIDAAGGRRFGAAGAVLLPVDTVNKLAPVATRFGDGALVCVLETSLGPIQHKVRAVRMRGDGTLAGPVVDASVAVSEKLRLQATASASGVAMLCWSDRRADSGDVFAQNVNPNGTLGANLGATLLYGCTNPAQSMAVLGRPAVGMPLTLIVDNPLLTQPAGSPSVFLLAAQPAPGFPCGIGVPGFGMQGNGAPGEVLVDLTGPVLALPGSSLPSARLRIDVPLELGFVGARLYVQGALLDPLPAAVAPIGLGRAARLELAF